MHPRLREFRAIRAFLGSNRPCWLIFFESSRSYRRYFCCSFWRDWRWARFDDSMELELLRLNLHMSLVFGVLSLLRLQLLDLLCLMLFWLEWSTKEWHLRLFLHPFQECQMFLESPKICKDQTSLSTPQRKQEGNDEDQVLKYQLSMQFYFRILSVQWW